MLFQLGAVQFSTQGLAPHEVSREASADFAEKDVIGVLKPAEFVGEGDDEITFTCCAPSPEFGGLSIVNQLDQIRVAGVPQILVRGDGTSLGWRRLTKLSEKHRYLDASGVGKVIDFSMTLKKSQPPSVTQMMSLFFTLIS